MRVIKKLYGQRFGRLTAIEPVGYAASKRIKWLCRCDCGNETEVASDKLISGHTRSCGCIISDLLTARNKASIKPRNERLYRIYYGMMSRCFNVKCDAYRRYGARGITVCPEWKGHFYDFEKWALSHGYDNSLTIDRIDNDGNYEPDNCRWTTMKVQSNNRHPAGWFKQDEYEKARQARFEYGETPTT